MTTKVKICGLRNEVDIDVALEYKVDYIGLVFFDPSPRNISISDGKRLARHVAKHAKVVALVVDAQNDFIMRISDEIQPDIYQLHGSENVERIQQISRLTSCQTIKVIKVASSMDVEKAYVYENVADHILFDAKAPSNSLLPGGNGIQFDWNTLEKIRPNVDFMLSGGLTPDNVQLAIHSTGAKVVDTSSGVEVSPGRKDPILIRAFIQAAKSL